MVAPQTLTVPVHGELVSLGSEPFVSFDLALREGSERT